MAIFETVLQLLGGLAVFIYGIQFLSEGTEKVAGARLLGFLEKAAGNRIKGLLFGAVAVGLLQSLRTCAFSREYIRVVHWGAIHESVTTTVAAYSGRGMLQPAASAGR